MSEWKGGEDCDKDLTRVCLLGLASLVTSDKECLYLRNTTFIVAKTTLHLSVTSK